MVEPFIKSSFVCVDKTGPFIPNKEIRRLMEDLMKEFDGIYCGVMPSKAGITLSCVHSSKTNKAFCKMRVK